MPSPFPGMDPWLESPGVFPDLHNTLITYLGDTLNASLPEPYFARTATRVWIEDQRREPDVGVFDRDSRPPPGSVDVADVCDLDLRHVDQDPKEIGAPVSDPDDSRADHGR